MTVFGNSKMMIIYFYDPMGNRIAKEVDSTPVNPGGEEFTRYVLDGQHVILETDKNGTTLRRKLYGPGVDQLLAVEELNPDGSTHRVLWPVTDRLGSVRYVVGLRTAEERVGMPASEADKPTILKEFMYNAFGLPTEINRLDLARRQTSGSNDIPRLGEGIAFTDLFTAREWDAEAGLYYYRARYYDPFSQRFISEDPMGFAAGDMNLYRYVGNNPTNFTDPSGQFLVSGSLLLGAALTAGLTAWVGYEASRAEGVASGQGTQVWGAYAEALSGGLAHTLNGFTAGLTDFLGVTDSSAYQEERYKYAGLLGATSRELFLTALTFGTGQILRGTAALGQVRQLGVGVREVISRGLIPILLARATLTPQTWVAARNIHYGLTLYELGTSGYHAYSGVKKILNGKRTEGLIDLGFEALGGYGAYRGIMDEIGHFVRRTNSAQANQAAGDLAADLVALAHGRGTRREVQYFWPAPTGTNRRPSRRVDVQNPLRAAEEVKVGGPRTLDAATRQQIDRDVQLLLREAANPGTGITNLTWRFFITNTGNRAVVTFPKNSGQ